MCVNLTIFTCTLFVCCHSILHALERISEHEIFAVDRFRAFIKEHPNFLFPAIFLQNILQTEIMGISYWDKAKLVRKELSHGKEYINWKILLHEVEVMISLIYIM